MGITCGLDLLLLLLGFGFLLLIVRGRSLLPLWRFWDILHMFETLLPSGLSILEDRLESGGHLFRLLLLLDDRRMFSLRFPVGIVLWRSLYITGRWFLDFLTDWFSLPFGFRPLYLLTGWFSNPLGLWLLFLLMGWLPLSLGFRLLFLLMGWLPLSLGFRFLFLLMGWLPLSLGFRLLFLLTGWLFFILQRWFPSLLGPLL